jgi:hypothetical protein
MRGVQARRLIAVCCAPWLLASCSYDPIVPPTPVEAIYGDPLETQLVPFPSNRFTVPDPSTKTGLRVDVSGTVDAYVAGYEPVVRRLGEMDGFSTAGGVAIGFDGPIDGASFAGPQGGKLDHELDPAAYTAADAPIVLIDVDPTSPERGKAFGLLPRYFAQAKDDFYPLDEFTVVAKPTEPLEPGRTYMFAATRRVLGRDGAPVARSKDMHALLADPPPDDYAASVQEALAVLSEHVGIEPDDVVVASVFTTATVRDELVALAEVRRAAPLPVLSTPWTVETMPEPGTDPRIRFRAQFRAPEYRGGDGTFLVEDGVPVAQGEAEIEVFLAFSDREVSGPRPVVIYQHGLGGDKDGCWGTAERLAELGVAVVAIDSPEHGFRGDGSGNIAKSVFAFFAIDPDNFAFDMGGARDNLRQMAVDQLELVRFLQGQASLDLLPVGAPDGVPDLDVSQLLYIGHSFGAVQGPTIFALAPEIRHAVWNVGGDGLTLLFEDSDTFRVLIDLIKPDDTTDGQLARFFAATQGIIDPGDPINYARFGFEEPLTSAPGFGPRSVLLQEVMDDTIVPNSSTDAVARAARLDLIAPVLPVPGLEVVAAPAKGTGPGGSTAVVAQFATMNGGERATHGELIFAPEARAQYVEFFRSGLADGVATVITP